VGKPALHGPPPGVQVGKPGLHRGQVGTPALHRPRATEQPRNRATRYRATASSVLDPFGAFHHLPQRFLIDWMSLRGSLVLVVVRDHEAAALEISVAQHRPFDDDADVRAEHLRRHAARFYVDVLRWVVAVVLDGGAAEFLDRAGSDHAA